MCCKNDIPVVTVVTASDEKNPSEHDSFMDLMLDDGFKRTFGEESGKTLFIGLLNVVIPGVNIVDLSYIQNQSHNFGRDTKRSIYDVQCELSDGTKIIVEVQRSLQDDYRERALYYGSMPIAEQTKIGADGYRLLPVYVVSFVNFDISHSEKWRPKIRSEYRLTEVGGSDQMTDRLTFIYVELGRFNKNISTECLTFEEKLYFCLKYIYQLNARPENFDDAYFVKLFERASVIRLTAKEHEDYIRAMTTETDIKSRIASARRQGQKEGREEGEVCKARETAAKMKNDGIPVDLICKYSGLPAEAVREL